MNIEEIKSRINPQYVDCPGTESHERKWLCDRIEQLEAENAALREDAERYRWLRERVGVFNDGYYHAWMPTGSSKIEHADKLETDRAIDAARGK